MKNADGVDEHTRGHLVLGVVRQDHHVGGMDQQLDAELAKLAEAAERTLARSWQPGMPGAPDLSVVCFRARFPGAAGDEVDGKKFLDRGQDDRQSRYD